MKALTISQPYANLIASGEKWVENRTWHTDYRGPLAIHAGRGTQYLTHWELGAYPTGVVIAVCRLIACLSVEETKKSLDLASLPDGARRFGWEFFREFLDHEYTEGPYGLVLADVQKFSEHIPATGHQFLWDWDERIPEANTES